MIAPVPTLDSERTKKLGLLKQAMETGDPQAKIAYYTEKEGHGWLVNHKQQIAKNNIDPLIKKYTAEYEDAKDKLKKSSKQTTLFRSDDLQQEKDDTAVLNRLHALPSAFDWIGILLDIVITALGLIIVYLLIRRFFTPVESSPVI